VQGDQFLRLFISHTHHHKVEVAALKTALIPYGVSSFVAHQDIRPTREWEDVIEVALATCHAGAAYLTEHFHASEWTDQEVGFCVGRGVLVVPVKVGVDPYGLIGKYQAVQGANRDASSLAAELVETFRRHELTRAVMAEAIVDRFYHSYSFNNARANLKLIQTIPVEAWTPAVIERVRSAAAENHEIVNADVGFGRSTVAADALDFVGSIEKVRSAA
jgi:hypothetical protein